MPRDAPPVLYTSSFRSPSVILEHMHLYENIKGRSLAFRALARAPRLINGPDWLKPEENQHDPYPDQ